MKILYATDGFDPAIAAGELLEKVADKDRVDVTVMSVTHAGIPAPEHAVISLDPVAERRKDTLALVDATTEKLIAQGFRATARVAEGHPGLEIVRAVEDDWYDLVVMGAGRRSWLGGRLLGSVSTYVLHSSPWSVLIVHEALPQDGPARILVGADGSRGTDLATRSVAGLADPERTRIDVVSVVALPLPTFVGAPGAFAVPLVVENERMQGRRELAQRDANHTATQLKDAGFEVETRVVDGHPTEELLKLADREGFDLVAAGSRGLGPLRRALLGSVSDHLARHARAALIGRRLTA